MNTKRNKLDNLVELSVELGKELWQEKMTRDHLWEMRMWTRSIRRRLKPGTRLIRPPENRDNIVYPSDESLGVQYRRELGLLEKERRDLTAFRARHQKGVHLLRTTVNRLKQELLAN